MSLLSAHELIKLIDCGVINAKKENVNASSIDVRLADKILLEEEIDCVPWETPDEEDLKLFSIDLTEKKPLNFVETEIPDDGLVIYPSQFFLASTIELFNLPTDISCQFILKSSLGRSGLQHMHTGWCDAGWTNSHITMQLKNVTNYHALTIRKGMKIGQVVFFRHTDAGDFSYANLGQYNNQLNVQASKGVR